MTEVLRLEGVSKSFILHLMDGVRLPVVTDVNLSVAAGECVVLGGPSGVGKSSILKMVYGNYRADAGRIRVRSDNTWQDVSTAAPRAVLALRQNAISYVSQFLRVIPRVSTFDIVVGAAGTRKSEPESEARRLLGHLAIPERLWKLPPATFSGGEQQRVNIARGFIANRPLLLLDEPTAALDKHNRHAVIDLILEKKRQGTAILAIFHDTEVRDAVADRIIDVTCFTGRDASSQLTT